MAELQVSGRWVNVRQATRYPWDGTVTLTVETDHPTTFTLHLRVPGWCERYRLVVNGEAAEPRMAANGYLSVARAWKSGDRVTYAMDMPIRPVWANPAVRQLQGRVAIQRGPIVYCLEGADHGNLILDRISVDPATIASEFVVEHRPDFLGGSAIIRGTGNVIQAAGWNDDLYRTNAPAKNEIAIMAVPYCVWDNREPGEMRVWLRTT
jgi:DUF1680 family protein